MARPSPHLRFRRPRLRSPTRARLWQLGALALGCGALWWFGLRPIVQEGDWIAVDTRFAICNAKGEREEGCVVDGDTLVIGYGPKRRRIRLTGFDAPELDGACEAEREQAIRARKLLHQWLSQGAFEWDGGIEPARDQYGRELRSARRATTDGSTEELAEVMIAQDLADESGWGAVPRDWCE